MSYSYNLLHAPRSKFAAGWRWSERQSAMAPGGRGPRRITGLEERVMKRMSLWTVFVKGYDEAIEFYTRKLGFVVAEDVPFGNQRWVTLRLPDDETVAIVF